MSGTRSKWHLFLGEHKGKGYNMEQLSKLYRKLQHVQTRRAASYCVGLNQEDCANKVSCHWRRHPKTPHCYIQPKTSRSHIQVAAPKQTERQRQQQAERQRQVQQAERQRQVQQTERQRVREEVRAARSQEARRLMAAKEAEATRAEMARNDRRWK
jgi:hypothetical protein